MTVKGEKRCNYPPKTLGYTVLTKLTWHLVQEAASASGALAVVSIKTQVGISITHVEVRHGSVAPELECGDRKSHLCLLV